MLYTSEFLFAQNTKKTFVRAHAWSELIQFSLCLFMQNLAFRILAKT